MNKKNRFYRLVLAGTLVFGAVSAAHATTLDFTAFPFGYQGTTVLNLPEATVTGSGTDLFVGSGDLSNSICSISGGSCEADLRIDFASDVSSLVFDVGGYGVGDFVSVTAYNSADIGIGNFDITGGGSYGFGGLAGISWIYFADSSTNSGVSYGNITFDQGNVAVPEPGTLPLLLLGIVGLGLALRLGRRPAARAE
ncbi:MAG: PEP-CTERM sorting domain-containing protein [Rhodanobacteraceae bacterium]